MAQFDYQRMRIVADNLIRKFGMQAVLRRASGDRPCLVAITQYEPKDQATQLTNPTDRRVVMSAIGLDDVPPDNEQDQLITFVQPAGTVQNEVLPFTCPVKIIAPAGVVVMYEFTVRR